MGKGEYSITAGGLLKPSKPLEDDQKPLQQEQPAVVIIAQKPKKAKSRSHSAVLARLQASANNSPCLTVLVTAAVALIVASAVLTLLALLAHGGLADLPHFGSPKTTEVQIKSKEKQITEEKNAKLIDFIKKPEVEITSKEKQIAAKEEHKPTNDKHITPKEEQISTKDAKGKQPNMIEVIKQKFLPASLRRPALAATADHCVHTRRGRCNHTVIHDTKVGTSAIVFPRYQRCLLFYPVNRAVVPVCPNTYPWGMDRDMGILPAVSPVDAPAAMAEFTAQYRLVQRCLASMPLTADRVAQQGEMIAKACNSYTSYRVMSVLAIYRSKRVGRSADEAHENLLGKDGAALSPFSNQHTAAELDAAVKSGDGVATHDGFAWAAPGWRKADLIQTAVVDQQGDEVDDVLLPVKDVNSV